MRYALCCALLLFGTACTEEPPPVVVDETADGTTVSVAVDQTLLVKLTNWGDGGYSAWELDVPPDSAVLEYRGFRHEEPTSGLPGDFGTDVFEFRGVAPGAASVEASASQPWLGGDTVLFSLDVAVE